MNVQLATLPPHPGSADRAAGWRWGYQAVIDRQSILRKGSRAGFATRTFLMLFNADRGNVSLHLGGRACDLNSELMFDTSASHTGSHTLEHLDSYLLKGGSLTVLRPKLPTGTRT